MTDHKKLTADDWRKELNALLKANDDGHTQFVKDIAHGLLEQIDAAAPCGETLKSSDWNDLIFDLAELRAHFEDRADITNNGGPNWEMCAQKTIESAIEQLGALKYGLNQALTNGKVAADRLSKVQDERAALDDKCAEMLTGNTRLAVRAEAAEADYQKMFECSELYAAKWRAAEARATRAEGERDEARAHSLDNAVLAHGWMRMHNTLLGFVQERPTMLRELIASDPRPPSPKPSDVPDIIAKLAAAEGEVRTARQSALEEAAKICESEAVEREENAALALQGSQKWGHDPVASSMAQSHKAVTARALAKTIRALAHDGKEGR